MWPLVKNNEGLLSQAASRRGDQPYFFDALQEEEEGFFEKAFKLPPRMIREAFAKAWGRPGSSE